MDDQARAIGWRVRYWRKRRNLDRHENTWSSSHFMVVSQHLPKLLGDAQFVVLTTSAAD